MRSLSSNKAGVQAALAVVALICIVIAAVLIIKQTRTEKRVGVGSVFYYCTNCKKEFVDSSDKIPPIKCPYCGQVTGAYARKCRCKECGKVFRAYLIQWDLDAKHRLERRRQGESVPYGEKDVELVSGPEGEYWVDDSSPEGIELMTNIFCPNPDCGATGEDIELVFPGTEEKTK